MLLLFLPPDDAVRRPVLPGRSMYREAPSEVAALLPVATASKRSTIEVGGVVCVFPLVPKKPSTRSPDRVVVRDGAAMSDEPDV
jgi:hypothetical protein